MTSRGSATHDVSNPELLVPGKEWRDSLNATCNRLSTQYLQLLKAASAASQSTTTASTQSSSSLLPSVSTSSGVGTGTATNSAGITGSSSGDSGAVAAVGQPSIVGTGGGTGTVGTGTGTMTTLQDPPPPALAYEVIRSQLSCQLATENLCVAASQLLTLIRQLRLSILITDTSTMTAEEVQACQEIQNETERATKEAKQLEEQWIQLRNNMQH